MQLKKLKKRNLNKLLDRAPKVGEEVVTETSVAYSSATVVWQDGTIEKDISSRELYPIHHLDEHVSKFRITFKTFANSANFIFFF